MNQIIFVGIHNKPGKVPWDKSTKSGEIIHDIADRCKNELPGIELIVGFVNLFSLEYLPDGAATKAGILSGFIDEHNDRNALFVLCGLVVQSYLTGNLNHTVSVNHPAYAIRRGKVDKYVDECVNAILNYPREYLTKRK